MPRKKGGVPMDKQTKIPKKLVALSITALLLAGTTTAWADTTAYGIKNDSGTTLTVTDSTDKTVSAASGDAATPALAYGLYNGNSTYSPINIQGDLHLVTSATHSAGGEFHAYAAYAGSGDININTADNGATGLGKKVQLEGELSANGSNLNAYLDTADSYLQGTFKDDLGTATVTFANGATWRPVFDNRYGSLYIDYDPATHSSSYVDTFFGQLPGGVADGSNLVLKGGVVDLTWDNAKRTDARQLSAYYNGSGTFIINTNITQNPLQGTSVVANSDLLQLMVFKEDASLTLKVNYDPGFAKGKSFTGYTDQGLTITNNGTANLTVNTTSTAYNAKNFTPILKETSMQGAETWYVTGFTASNSLGSAPNANVLTVADGHYALHDLWLYETNSLTKRMGELRDSEVTPSAGIWARYAYDKLEAGSGEKADIKTNLFQLGYDKDIQGAHGTHYTGAAFSYAKGTSDFSHGDGNVKESTLSLYHTYIGNDGRYYDLVLKGGKFMNDFTISGDDIVTSNSDYSTWAYSLSGEVGKRTTWGDGLYVEPQAELTLGHMNSADYTTSTGMATKADAANLALVRLGVALGKKFKTGNIYARASYYHDFGSGIAITADDVNYHRDAAKNWGVFALGGNVKAGRNCSLYGEVSKHVGQLKSPVGVNVGARWSF